MYSIIEYGDGVCPGDSCEYADPEFPHKHEAKHLYNAKVRITRAEDGTTQLLVNGEDLSRAVFAHDFAVTFEDGEARVTMTIATEDYEIDFPEAVVEVK